MSNEPKVALVTGASSGIGAGIVRSLATKGMIVIGVARRDHLVKEIASEFKPSAVLPYKCDVTSEKEISEMFQWIKEKFPRSLSLVVCNAGITFNESLLNGTFSNWKKMTEVNLLAAGLVTQLAIKYFLNNDKEGKIIYLNSLVAHLRIQREVLRFYGVTKDALNSLRRYWTDELTEKNPSNTISISEICPGLVKTEFVDSMFQNDENMKADIEEFYKTTPHLTVEDVVNALNFVISRPDHVVVEDVVLRPTKQPL